MTLTLAEEGSLGVECVMGALESGKRGVAVLGPPSPLAGLQRPSVCCELSTEQVHEREQLSQQRQYRSGLGTKEAPLGEGGDGGEQVVAELFEGGGVAHQRIRLLVVFVRGNAVRDAAHAGHLKRSGGGGGEDGRIKNTMKVTTSRIDKYTI